MAQEQYDDYPQPRGLWANVKARVFGMDDAEYDEEEEESQVNAPEARRKSSLRLDHARPVRVAVRKTILVFKDAKIAADGLKAGEQQIVNLERVPETMQARIIDFLNGVVYALDGTADRIGEKVYLFAPANVEVKSDASEDVNDKG